MSKRQTADWQSIEVKDLSNWHLANCYKIVMHAYENWKTIQYGWWHDAEDIRYDEETYIGEEVFKQFPIYKEVVDEYNKRFNSDNLDFLHHNWHIDGW